MWENVHPEEAARRLFAGLKQVGNCFEWQGYTNPKGYGHISIKGKQYYTHRVMIEIQLKRRLRTEEIVCHDPQLCNNPGCCNPNHLRVGNLMNNVADRVMANQTPKKVRERKRLTEADVLRIRLRLALGHSAYKIAADMNRGETTIRDIRNWRTWRSVTLPAKAECLRGQDQLAAPSS